MGAPDQGQWAGGSAASLGELETRLAYELECLSFPAASWVPDRYDLAGRRVGAVLVVGGGQAGLATAFALRREGVHDVTVVDRSPEGREGPWVNFARMLTLRTPKYLTGPDYGIPSLTFRSWFECQHGPSGWETLQRIPTPMWMDYLVWFRKVTGIHVFNGIELAACSGTPDGLVEVRLKSSSGSEHATYRHVVLANGMDGGGCWHAPPDLTRPLPRNVWAHTSEHIDLEALHGRRVAVLGAGAAAFDAAAAALDHGATVDLYFRRPGLMKIEHRAWLEQAGFLRGFGSLDDRQKWAVMHRLLSLGAPAPESAIARVAAHPSFAMYAGTGWLNTAYRQGRIEITTNRGPREADFAIFGTGARYDLALRPELSSIAPLAARWCDRFEPDDSQRAEEIGMFPYLGRGFELIERIDGTAPWINRIHLFNYAATPSIGVSGSSGTGLKTGLQRLVGAIVEKLYADSFERHLEAMPWPSPSTPSDGQSDPGTQSSKSP